MNFVYGFTFSIAYWLTTGYPTGWHYFALLIWFGVIVVIAQQRARRGR